MDAASDAVSARDTGLQDGSHLDATTTTDATSSTDTGIDVAASNGDGGCGYDAAGVALHVTANIDVCLPPVVCTSETCPPGLGTCVGGRCVFASGYDGVATLPEAWVTYYCDLTTEGCHGVTQDQFPEVTAQDVASATGLPECIDNAGGSTCVGISAAPPMIVGNSQLAVDPATGKEVTSWGLGLTEASGLCYSLAGPGGSALVALTDRCGGYCTCNGSAPEECGPCVNATDMQPDCPCVGTAPPTYTSCCGATCGGTVVATCDWCASNNHSHFDLDVATFNHVCGSEANLGSCQLTRVGFVPCLPPAVWPPQ